MSIAAEKTLIRLLPDNDALGFLAREGLDIQILPTDELRPVVEWALNYRTVGGKAPTVMALLEEFGDLFSDKEIDLEDELPQETIEWALSKLEASFLKRKVHLFTRALSKAIVEAPDEDKAEVVALHAAELAEISQVVASHKVSTDMRVAARQMLDDYREVAAGGVGTRGMRFGLPEIDDYTGGIWEGELALWGAPTKSGKSFALDYVAHAEWSRERIVALFTLENSIKMTQQRLACMALHISVDDLMHGRLNKDALDALEEWVEVTLPSSEVPLRIFHPPPGMCTPQAIVQQARAVGADSLIVDQLTFMQALGSGMKETQPQVTGRMLHELKALIDSGRRPVPCLLAHQFNRSGTKDAAKSGRLDMGDLANSSEAERTPDWIFGLYATEEQKRVSRMAIQTLGSRRAKDIKDFEVMWQIDVGYIRVIEELVA